jgi:hypothetical protein
MLRQDVANFVPFVDGRIERANRSSGDAEYRIDAFPFEVSKQDMDGRNLLDDWIHDVLAANPRVFAE